MRYSILKTILGGIIGTIGLNIIMIFVAPFMGVHLNPPFILSILFGTSTLGGWIMSFLTGILFAFIYSIVFIPLLSKVQNVYIKGIIFGVAIGIVAVIGLYAIGAIELYLNVITAITIVHIIYGMCVSRSVS